ncbi:MAG: hypothetical protein HGA39_09255 [Coriobacteriia bacterium]|nr:hypothetical protein [Coriobacteriia bacterium]
MRDAINAIRAKIGVEPRHFGLFARRYVSGSRPSWMEDDDDLMEFFRNQDLLMHEGGVVWGALVQANTLLFSPGKMDHPAMVIYAPDRSLDACPEWLSSVARELYQLKNTMPEEPDRRELASMITDEMERGLGWTVPSSITGGKLIKSSSVMVFRQHLPHGVLKGDFFPLLFHPDTSAVMIVPSRYWS